MSVDAPARTPEELELLLEDSLLLGDLRAVAELFHGGALLVLDGEHAARGGAEIARRALATWHGDDAYIADPCRVSQVHDVALVVTRQSVNVARRDANGGWRYLIVQVVADEWMRKDDT